MKILLTTIYAYPPRGGLGTYIQELKTGLEKQGHSVDVLARNNDTYSLTRGNKQYPLTKRSGGTGLLHSLLPSAWLGNRVYKYMGTIQDEASKFFDAVKMVDLKQYQVIHAQDIVSASVLKYYKPVLTPLILTIHGCVTAEYYYYGFIQPNSIGWKVISTFESGAINRTDAVILPSQWLLDVYKKCNIPTNNMSVIKNGIDIEAFQRKMVSTKTGLNSPPGKKVIICTGRLEKVKGQHVLINALAKLKARRSDWVCWMVGRGKNERALKKQVSRLGLNSHVKFLGMRKDVPALLKQADIFVIPSLQDNYPYSLVEAYVAGKAIIASQVGGMTEMVQHSRNGLLVPPDNSHALYMEMRGLLENPGKLKALSQEARSWGKETFALEKMTNEVLHIYNNALASKGVVRR